MDAVILFNKPQDMTSFQAVNHIRHKFNEKKAGHTGTLDPNATGLMIVLLGKYTKLNPYAKANHKHYIATFELGKATDSEDIWGNVIETQTPSSHTQQELDEATCLFIGKSQQIPPMYSAIKMQGKKLYELARQGKEVERKPRDIEITSLQVKQLSANVYQMDTVVSSGTYIRTLIKDYCLKLNEIGTMTSLQRVGIEDLSLDEAKDLSQIEGAMISPLRIIDPSWHFYETDEVKSIMEGKKIQVDTEYDRIVFTHQGNLLAAYTRYRDDMFQCERGLF